MKPSPVHYARRLDHETGINPDGSGVELADISADPEERNNVAESNPDVVQRLKGNAARLPGKRT
jgi:hypothetical protein